MLGGTVWLSSIGLGWYCSIWAIGILGCITARRRYRLRPRPLPASAHRPPVPGVSILRPLKGLDINLYENLESTFQQDYSNFEIIFSVADEHDQAIPVVRDLVTSYPHVNAKLIIGEKVVGVNPKVNNLIRSYNEAAHDLLWIIDSNVTVDRGTLARSVDVFINSPSEPSKRIGLVHHVPHAIASANLLGAKVEEVFLNTNHAKMYLAINAMAVDSCVIGKSNLFRRSDVSRVNGSLQRIPKAETGASQPDPCGFHVFGRFLAEDNMLAGALWHELGLRHDLSCDVANNIIGNMSLSDYIWRRVRWIRVRKHMVLPATIIEPFTECIVLSLIGAASLNYLFSVPVWISIFFHYTIWVWVDLDVYSSLAGGPLPLSSWTSFFSAWLVREALALPIYCLGIFGSTVQWRGRTYEVLRHGEVEEVTGAQKGWFSSSRGGHRYERLQSGNP